MKVKNNGMNCNFAVVILMSMFMLVLGCDKDTDINSAVRRTGRAVGSGATRFFNGVGEGIDAASAAIKEEKDGVVFVVCEITARDGCRDKLLAELDKIVPVVRREKGCISYTPLVDIASGIENQSPQRVNTVTLVECWDCAEGSSCAGSHGRIFHSREESVRKYRPARDPRRIKITPPFPSFSSLPFCGDTPRKGANERLTESETTRFCYDII